MFKTFIISILFCLLITKQCLLTKANECDLNSECKLLRDCPQVLHTLHLIRNKPYCNLNQNDTYVCCSLPQTKYIQEKDEDLRSVRECKSYQRLRSSCETSLTEGGTKADPKELPFMALLYYKYEDSINWLCGGTLISNKFVLATAHCFFLSDEPNFVRLGELDYSTTTDDASPVDFVIKNSITHPQYWTTDIQTKYNDIALVELASEVKYNEYIMPACLPLVDGREFPEYLEAAWSGPKGTARDASSHLLKKKLDRVDDNACFEKIEKVDELEFGLKNRTQLCAASFKDTCYEDTRETDGPLVVDHPDYKCTFLVLGIFSFDDRGCDKVAHITVYTRISSYLGWIEQIVWKEPARLS